MPKCFNGKEIYQKYLDRRMVVPCAKCRGCKGKTKLSLASRIIQESLTAGKDGYHQEFVTLTYGPENLPTTDDGVPTLSKASFSAFMHRCRKLYPAFRYFAVGEYGERTMRPHIHMAIFCQDPTTATLVARKWEEEFGHANRKELIGTRCVYLAKYTAKGLTKSDDSRLERDQEPEFRSHPRPGLGFEFARVLADHWSKPENQEEIKKRGDIRRTFRFNGATYPISNYTLNKTRELLGIPTRHIDRAYENEDYESFFPVMEAEQCAKSHKAQETKLKHQERNKLHRNHYQRF